jgi:hypothetical protein
MNLSPTHNRDAVVLAWHEAKNALQVAKDREAILRKEVLAMSFDTSKPGTQKVDLGNDWSLKANVKLNYKIMKHPITADYGYILDVLAQLPQEVADELVRWEPNLSESRYKKLNKEEQEKVNIFLEIKEGSSSLELIAPKTGEL